MKEYLDYCNGTMQPDCTCENRTATDPAVYTGRTKLPKNPVTTMAYVPFQTDTAMYDIEKALCQGTAFPDLDKPFWGGKCI